MEPITFLDTTLSNYFNIQPSVVKGEANNAVDFNKRYLFTKIYSCYKFTLPKDWALNFFRFWLFNYGSIAAVYTKEYGWICSPYSVTKLDLYYQPAVIEVTNKVLKKPRAGVIGLNAGVIKIMDDFFGLNDIVTRYATQLANIDKSINVNLMNCNVTAFFQADNKKQADEIKEAYARATEGNPLIVVNKAVMGGDRTLEAMFPGAANNYMVDKLLTARRTVVNNFLTEIGIKNANYDKKERLNSMEVSQNIDETSAIVSVIYENLKESFARLNEISGLNLDVNLAYDYNELKEG